MSAKTAKTEMLNFRIDPETLERLRVEAEKDERTLSWMALHLLKKGLDAQTKPKGRRKVA